MFALFMQKSAIDLALAFVFEKGSFQPCRNVCGNTNMEVRMCKGCGCQRGTTSVTVVHHEHEHSHGDMVHSHPHDHDHEHTHDGHEGVTHDDHKH